MSHWLLYPPDGAAPVVTIDPEHAAEYREAMPEWRVVEVVPRSEAEALAETLRCISARAVDEHGEFADWCLERTTEAWREYRARHPKETP